jgi:hypothetical protein
VARAQATITQAIDRHVEAQAGTMGYNGAAHLASYVASSVPDWAAEAQAFVTWRDQIWQAAIGMLGRMDPTNPPSVEAVLAELPDWPG